MILIISLYLYIMEYYNLILAVCMPVLFINMLILTLLMFKDKFTCCRKKKTEKGQKYES